jgi:bacterial/archaeal transporter family protein
METWILYALISAFFAGLTSVIAKLGIQSFSASTGIAIRTAVVFFIILIYALPRVNWQEVQQAPTKAWWFLAISGLTTSLSWIFYYQAIKTGQVSMVAFIDKGSILITILLSIVILGEVLTLKTGIAGGLILAGLVLLIWK